MIAGWAGFARRAAWVVTLCAASAASQETGGTAVVHMADGSSFPLQSWSLSYEYIAWKQGTPQFQTPPARKDAMELWLGKKAYPVKGASLEIQFTKSVREREVAGTTRRVQVAVPSGLVLVTADGKRTPLKLEPPHRDLVIPGADKGLSFSPRTFDLRGQTLTGTKRELCILSFSALVECPDDPAQQVARVEFQP